ncbi:MAG: SGNH/GDSL hydrolase family protein, partial [Kurthia sp.]|nr:SGNH/GDSL hydrolase family protein [Candidatus Kurthia equi]
VAEFMNHRFIDIHSCGINCLNRLNYIEDSVHPNYAGAELMSRPFISFLKNEEPRKVLYT